MTRANTPIIFYLIGVYKHHEGIAFARCVLFSFKEVSYQFWCIRDQEVKVPEIKIDICDKLMCKVPFKSPVTGIRANKFE